MSEISDWDVNYIWEKFTNKAYGILYLFIFQIELSLDLQSKIPYSFFLQVTAEYLLHFLFLSYLKVPFLHVTSKSKTFTIMHYRLKFTLFRTWSNKGITQIATSSIYVVHGLFSGKPEIWITQMTFVLEISWYDYKTLK